MFKAIQDMKYFCRRPSDIPSIVRGAQLSSSFNDFVRAMALHLLVGQCSVSRSSMHTRGKDMKGTLCVESQT